MTTLPDQPLTTFDDNAQHIAKRQYLQPGDGDIGGMFRRIANWVAGAEAPEARLAWAQKYYDLMAGKKFCPGGRVLAGAGTQHGNVLNCLQGDTLVETREGQKRIADLSGEVEILSQGGVYRRATFGSYGRQELYRVLLSNGETLEATAGHQWPVGRLRRGQYRKLTTLELVGQSLPIVPSGHRPERDGDYESGVQHGIVYGDGSRNTNGHTHAVQLFGHKRELAQHFGGFRVHDAVYSGREVTVAQGMRGELKSLPDEYATDNYWYGFFSGLLSTDGGVDDRGSAAIYQSDAGSLGLLARQLVRFGVKAASVRLFRHAEGGYGGKPAYALRLIKQTLLPQDFIREDQRERFERSFLGQTQPRNASLQVVAVEATGRAEEVYCCDEPETHTFVVQGGLLTGNCFVQGATEHDPASFEGVMEVARKLALVTKVGGGNGVNLDVYRPRAKGSRPDAGVRGWVYMAATHADVTDFIEGLMRPPTQPDGDKTPVAVRNWTRVVYGQAVAPELVALARQNGVSVVRALPEGVQSVPDDMGGIVDAARKVAEDAKLGLEPRLDLSEMRAEGAPIKGSGGTSSGPVSFLMEIFDNFLEWANRGAEDSGPINTLRFVYAPVLRVVRQGGCLHPDTLVHTERGTLRLRELVDSHAFGHQQHALGVATDEGWKHSPEGFNNGLAETLRVTLDSGLSVQGTPNHKLKVLRANGEREWVRLDELRAGDWAIQALDQHTGAPVVLEPPEEQHFNAKPIQTPDTLTGELAFWLGYLWGDGFVSGQRVGFAVAHGSPMLAETPRLFRDLFGLELRQEQKDNDASVVFVARSAALVNWLELNGLLKSKALTLEVPRAVRQAPRQVLGAFLRGLFEADGTLLHGHPQLSCASAQFAQDVTVLLGGLGIPVKLTRYEALDNRYSDREHYRLNVVSGKGLERYRERVGWLDGSRFEALRDFQPDLARESSWPLPHAAGLLGAVHADLPAGRKGRSLPFTGTRKTLSRSVRDERGLTASGYSALAENAQIAAALPAFDHGEFYSQVREVTPGGRVLTLDISVDDNHTYLANGLVTHNTRRGAGMATIAISHPDVLDFLTAKDLDREAAEGDISTFNISILITEQFWETLQAGGVWPMNAQEVPGKYYLAPQDRAFGGQFPELPDRAEDGARGVPVYCVGKGKSAQSGIPAAWLWDQIAQHAWSTGEPGLIFNDRVNEFSALKNLGERYEIRSTNPCGEIPLTVGEPCDLGAINLAAYVDNSTFDYATFRADVRTCVRFLDDVLDVNVFALEDNRVASQDLRRLGLGVMGLADALIKLGLRYDNEAGRETIMDIMSALREEAIAESERLGQERGVYPVYTRNADRMPHAPRRNVAVLTVAPTGTTSMLMGVSSGIEPVFSPFIWRKIGSEYRALLAPLFVELLETYPAPTGIQKDGGWDWDKVTEAVSENHGSVVGLPFIPDALQQVFVCAHDIAPQDHVRMQGTVQRAFDADGYAANSLSKTINLPNSATVQDVQDAYSEAYKTGCKGITVYRDGSRQFQVLSTSKKKDKKAEDAPAQAAAEVMGEEVDGARVMVDGKQPQPASPSTINPQPSAAKPQYERPARLSGITDMVKLTDPTSGHRRSFLVTVNHLDGKPVEVMVISGRAGDEANADSEALGRVVSIALQHGVPAQAIIKTLRGINGGLYGSYNGRLVGSKADLIAVALETFQKDMAAGQIAAQEAAGLPPLAGGSGESVSGVSVEGMDGASRERCPVCEERAVIREEGCLKCQACGYSKCG